MMVGAVTTLDGKLFHISTVLCVNKYFLKHSKDKEENIKWTNKPIKILGIYYGHDYIECEKLNCRDSNDMMVGAVTTLDGKLFHISTVLCVNKYFLKHSKDKEENIKWTNKPIKTLGIYYGHDYIECEKLNWGKKIEKMNSLFLSWSKRNLSILGKVLIIKALIIPIFTFIVSSCVIPEKYKKEIESKCFKFIWNGKPDKVKRNTLIGDFEKGGLKMIDIESYFISLKASWVSRLADSKFSNWKLIPLKYLNVFGKIWLIFKMNIDVKKHKQFLNNIPEFYKNVLTSWIKTGGGQLSSPLTFSNVRKQILWGNRFITFEKKIFIF